jgi:hypothetical protein
MSDQGRETILPTVTKHAAERMNARRLSFSGVNSVLCYGREVHVRGAVIYAIGQNEVDLAKRCGIDLQAFDGLHVVCSREGAILTVYRNRSLSGLRTRSSKNYRRTPSQSISGTSSWGVSSQRAA